MIGIRKGNMSQKIMLIGIVIAYFQIASTAKAYWADGQELLKWCSSEYTELFYIECIGYIQGHMDTALANGTFEKQYICLPENTTLAHVREIAVKYLKSHAAAMQKAAPLVLLDALHDVFPCKSSK
jgi:hypothetical protein